MKTTVLKLFSITTLVILLITGCAKPIDACFDYSPENPDTATVITFNGGCSENASYYTWNFGDESGDTTSDGFVIKHKYKTAGIYTVRLNAKRKDGVTIRKEKPTIEKTIVVQ